MRQIKGHASREFRPVMGIIATQPRPVYARRNIILVTERLDGSSIGYKACITSGKRGCFFHPDHIYACHAAHTLHDGDIVRMEPDGTIDVLWESSSHHNAFMLTEACNCRCVMCPQPPREHEPQRLRESYAVLDLLKGEQIEQFCITGGEPTLLGDAFTEFLAACIAAHPEASIDILTNGKAFSDRKFTRKVAQTVTQNVCFCVSLHSDIDTLHDFIVGSQGSYAKTSQGIYNLAEYGCKLEIRHVINVCNAKYLHRFSEHLYNYYPFCSHYAFMGMELYGKAAENWENLDISPLEYRQELCDAVLCLHRRVLPVSIYNVPLCLCAPEARKFCRQSISSWKNVYLPQCRECAVRQQCAGFFATSIRVPVHHIQPIRGEV